MTDNPKSPLADPIETYEHILEHEETDRQPTAVALDRVVTTIGHVVMWANLALIIAIIAQVSLRYFADINYPKLDEIQWHFYGLTTMVGLSYAMVKDSHVRVDVLHMNLRDSVRRVIEIVGILALLVPFLYLMIDQGYDYFWESFRVDERSDSPTGLPARWAFKAIIPLSFVLLTVAAIARLIHDVHALRTAPRGEGYGGWVVLLVLAGFAVVAVLLAGLVETTEEKLVVAMFMTFIGLLFTGFPSGLGAGGHGRALLRHRLSLRQRHDELDRPRGHADRPRLPDARRRGEPGVCGDVERGARGAADVHLHGADARRIRRGRAADALDAAPLRHGARRAGGHRDRHRHHPRRVHRHHRRLGGPARRAVAAGDGEPAILQAPGNRGRSRLPARSAS